MNRKLIAFFIFVSFWISIFVFTGTLFSGYHFTDDHEIINIQKSIRENGLIDAMQSIVVNDFEIRFRPFYYIHRIFSTYLFGTNFLFWSLQNLVLSILTTYFLFLFSYYQGFNWIVSLIFPLLTLVGSHSDIWWKLGPNETLGMFMFSASLFLLVRSLNNLNKFSLFLSVCTMILSSLSKESFTIIIPAYIIIFIVVNHKNYTGTDYISILIKNRNILLFLSISFIVEVLLIIFYVGTNKIGYAGIDDSFSVGNFIIFIINHFKGSIFCLLILLGIALVFINIRISDLDFYKVFKNNFPYLIICLFVIFPQYFLYFKSGFEDRYLIPLNFGFSFYIFSLLSVILYTVGSKKMLKGIFIVAILFTILFNLFSNALPKAIEFANEGNNTSKLFSEIEKNTTKSDSILIILDIYENFELTSSFITYSFSVIERNNISILPVKSKVSDKHSVRLDSLFHAWYANRIVKNVGSKYSSVVVFPFFENDEFKSSFDKYGLFNREDMGRYTLFVRK